MLQNIAAIVWTGNRKWYTIGIAVVAITLMLVFGENTSWTAE